MIINRLGTDCFVQDVLGDFGLELNEPYLLYKNGAGEVQGIWFYKVRECGEVVALLQKLRKTYAGASAAEKPAAPEVDNGGDAISGLLGMIDMMDAGSGKGASQPPAQEPKKAPAKPLNSSQKAKKAVKAAVEPSPQRILQRPGTGKDVVSPEAQISAAPARGAGGAGGLTRRRLKAALVKVMQSDAFVDMLYEELSK